MKKNKEKKSGIFPLTVLCFILIFLTLELITVLVVHLSLYKEIDYLIRDYSDNLDEYIEVPKGNRYPDRYELSSQADANGRVIVILYDYQDGIYEINLLSDAILYYLLPDFRGYLNPNDFDTRDEYDEYNETVNEQIESISENSIFIPSINELNKVKIERTEDIKGNEYYFRCNTISVNDNNMPSIRYAKILVMVNGEQNAQENIIFISGICSIIMFALSIIASFVLSRKASKPIEESLEKQMNFVGDASHELRTPLAIVQSKLENILTKSDQTVYEVSDDIAVSLKEVTRLSKLTQELLTLARDDRNTIELNLSKKNIRHTIEEISLDFVEIAKINNKELTLDLKDVECTFDESLIRQLMIILLDNANRYTTSGETINVLLYKQASKAIIEVQDTGIGISDDGLKKVFERFYREDKARSRESGGNGLGLSIAKSIVKKHKGKIYAKHNQPKGTIFVVELAIDCN